MPNSKAATLCACAYADMIRGAYPESGEYRIALYRETLNTLATDSYTPEGEWAGEGYKAGGAALSGWKLTTEENKASLAFADAEWLNADIQVKSALIYRESDGKAIRVIDFGRTIGVMGGIFTVFLSQGNVIELGAGDSNE
jgi:hypothetical protein